MSPKWEKSAHAVIAAMREKGPEKVWTGREVEDLALELGIAKERHIAFRIWEEIRKSDLVEGQHPETRFRHWRLKGG